MVNFSGDSATVIQGQEAGVQPQSGWPRAPKFRVVALAERGGGDHQQFVDAAKIYLNKLAAENDFAVDYITGTERINEESLAQYKLFIQLNYPPYRWTPIAKQAFEDYITQGKGGWIGFHHAVAAGRLRRLPDGSLVLEVSGRHPLYALPAGFRQGHGEDRGSIAARSRRDFRRHS